MRYIMTHFLEWFRKKKQKNYLECSLAHLSKVKETVNALYAALESIDNRDILHEKLHQVAQLEHQADEIRKKLAMEIAEYKIIFTGYEDLLEFLYAADSIADNAHAADRFLALFEGDMNDDTRNGLLHLCKIGCKSIEKLYTTVNQFTTVPKEDILRSITEIESLEDEADDVKRTTLRSVLQADYSANQLIILRDLIEAVENVCDMCKVVAGKLYIMSIKL